MFQTEPILWLQALASDSLTALLQLVSYLGTTNPYEIGAVAIAFGVDLRAGLALLQVVLWNNVVTELLKDAVALPRPYQVLSGRRGGARARLARVCVALGVLAGTGLAVAAIDAVLGEPRSFARDLLAAAIPPFLCIDVTARVAQGLCWYSAS